jgi:hypothetical protein
MLLLLLLLLVMVLLVQQLQFPPAELLLLLLPALGTACSAGLSPLPTSPACHSLRIGREH